MNDKRRTANAELPESVQRIADRLCDLAYVKAIALAGSRGTKRNDAHSDLDLYVYAEEEIPVAFRRPLLGSGAEVDNRFWEPGDEAVDATSGVRLDLMYRTPHWIEDQLDRVLVRHEASIGYSTCFWFNVLHSAALVDRDGWYQELQAKARVRYPEELRAAIVRKNWPILRKSQSSYRHQIELALFRKDSVSVQHRVTALLASFFDVWFALERTPHPGEKRLLSHLPPGWLMRVHQILDARSETLLAALDQLLDLLDERLESENFVLE